MNEVAASVPVMVWAAERAGLDDDALSSKYSKWTQWISGDANPTLRQLEDFARRTHVPFGYFFLPEPPEIDLPVPDFRTVGNNAVAEPSSALLDTIYLCQQRQDWFNNYARIEGLPTVAHVGSAAVGDQPSEIALRMRDALALERRDTRQIPTWTEALRHLIEHIEASGVLVMISSIVGSNSHRKLNLEEFRGFALADEYAPLIFVNGSDSKSAQMFTLAHELAHIWLGVSGVSDSGPGSVPGMDVERWCNLVAAELLVPIDEFRAAYDPENEISGEMRRLAREFKVSTLVVLRRMFDAGYIDEPTLWETYRLERARLNDIDQGGTGGGDFDRTLGARTGKRFARAVISSTLEGQTLFQEAFRMLGMRKNATFYEAARELGVTV